MRLIHPPDLERITSLPIKSIVLLRSKDLNPPALIKEGVRSRDGGDVG